MIHEYTEFGVTSRIHSLELIGDELRGMRVGKPFRMDGEIRLNLNGSLNKVTKIKFYNQSGKEITNSQVKLDTTTRIGIIVISGEEVLLMKRTTPKREFYAYPGGHVREGETNEAAFIREAQEELGVGVSTEKFYFIASKQEEGFGPERFYSVKFNTKPKITPEDPDDETTKFEWVKITEAKRLSNLYPNGVINLI